MQNFIVLGLVPGTQIQLTFIFWLGIAAAFFSLLMLVHVWGKRDELRQKRAVRQIARTINSIDLVTL